MRLKHVILGLFAALVGFGACTLFYWVSAGSDHGVTFHVSHQGKNVGPDVLGSRNEIDALTRGQPPWRFPGLPSFEKFFSQMPVSYEVIPATLEPAKFVVVTWAMQTSSITRYYAAPYRFFPHLRPRPAYIFQAFYILAGKEHILTLKPPGALQIEQVESE